MEREEFEKLIEAVKVMPLRPTDVIVVKTNMTLSADAAANIRHAVKNAFGDHKVFVLPKDMDVEIVRPES